MSDNLPALIDYSKALAGSDLLPAEYRGKPANVLVAIEYGKALGLEPMSAIQGITVIKGKPTASAALMAGLVRRAGHTLRITGNDKRAECTIIRNDDPDFQFVTVWTIDRAKQAGLTSNPSWSKYPDAMLKARAISECARNACSEILAGVQYTSEELEEPQSETVTAKRLTGITTKPITSQVPKAEKQQPLISEPEFDSEEPATVQDEIVDAEIIETEPEPEPDGPGNEPQPPGGDLISGPQLKLLHAQLGQMGVKDRDRGLVMISKIIGRKVESTKELTKQEASQLIDAFTVESDDET